ncbi:MAG: hypothetical protein M9894_20920 [Planctomycetes bacterium]|nr:hypothetical protein [Planctomycetota bacterium]
MTESPRLFGLDPMRARLLLGVLAVLAFAGLATIPVDGIDPATGVRVRSTPAKQNGRRAVTALTRIAEAQSVLRLDRDGDGVMEFGTLEDLRAAGLITDDDLPPGYAVEVRPSPARPQYRWIAVATPLTPGETGDRTYVVNHAGTVWALDGPVAVDDDCAIPPGATRVAR